MLLLLSSLWNSTLRTKRTSLFQRLFKSSSKIIRDLIKLQSVPAVAKFYLSGTCTNMSSHVECKSMGKGSIAISVEKLPRPLMEWSSTWSELICCMPENSVGSSLLVLTQNVWWWDLYSHRWFGVTIRLSSKNYPNMTLNQKLLMSYIISTALVIYY